jgi:hypothetical protein
MNAYHLLFVCQRVLHYEPRILQTLFYAILPSWMTWCTFSIYPWVYMMMGYLNIKIHNQSVATFEACMLFRGLCSTRGVITKGFLSIL